MERLLWPMMIKMSSMPDASASSMMYWIVVLSTIASISFGHAFVAGKKRYLKMKHLTDMIAEELYCEAKIS